MTIPDRSHTLRPAGARAVIGAMFAAVGASMVCMILGSVLSASPASAATVGPCGAPVDGSVRVVVVVDDGVRGVSVDCVVVARGTTGSQLLRQRAAQLGTAVPGHAGSGLLCTIDSFPDSGCAETSSGSYWANFSGQGGGWEYSNYNPFIRRVCDGDVEGWRYVLRGTGAAGDASPRVSPDAVRPVDARGCQDASIPSPTAAAPMPGAPTRSGGAPGDASGGATAADGASSSAASDDRSDGSDPAAIDASGAAPGADEDPQRIDARRPDQQLPASQSASTSWIGLVIAAVVIGVLGSAALLRSRRTA